MALILLVAALSAGALLAGCGKDNPAKPNTSVPPYPALSTPQNVLTAMILSYQRRDSTEYKLVYDEALYLGESIDQTQFPATTDSFYWQDEARHIASLAQSPTVIHIDMDFGAGWTRLPSAYVDDPPGSALINVSNPQITIFLTNGDGFHVSGVGRYEFRFAPTVAAPGDTTWKIIHWTEVRSQI